MNARAPVAFGLRAHSGWAVLVAVAGSAASPIVADRRRLVLSNETFPRQCYHAAENLPAAQASALIERSLETAHRLGREAIAASERERLAAGQTVIGAGLLENSARPLPGELSAILGSHALIHSAEGEMYRAVLRGACGHAAIAVHRLREREILALGERRFGMSGDDLRSRLVAMKKDVGPPWGQDQKLAALAAWLVLAGGSVATNAGRKRQSPLAR